MAENPNSPLTVEIRDAAVRFDDVPLFEGINLTLEGGHWTCLLGASGIGKTSLLRLLAGLAGSEGEACIRCRDGLPLNGRVAWMAQQDLLLPWATALDNVLIGARLRNELGDGARERALALLSRVGLGDHASALPRTLSGGMRQRVALARTLFEDQPVVLMDEPFSALDAITRHRLQGEAAALLTGRTVLLITHDPLEALRLGHEIYVMQGTPVRLSDPLVLGDPVPRAESAPEISKMQTGLWEQLAA